MSCYRHFRIEEINMETSYKLIVLGWLFYIVYQIILIKDKVEDTNWMLNKLMKEDDLLSDNVEDKE